LVETLTQAEGRASPVVVDIVPSLSLLVAGTSAPHPQELLSSKEFPNFSENAQRHYGVVIYDTPAALENADAYVVASRVGSAILLARRNRTKVAAVRTVTQALERFQCEIAGTVLGHF
jgi:Mrp family chromosome partitioning ATPase